MSPDEEKAMVFRTMQFLSDEVQRLDRERVEPKEIAAKTVDGLIKKLQDEDTVEKVVAVWGNVLDRHLGKSLRKILWTIFILVCGVVVVEFGWLGKIIR